ncbi:MAG: hypothetical protein RIC89_14440 [Pseudomonadales bacterium]
MIAALLFLLAAIVAALCAWCLKTDRVLARSPLNPGGLYRIVHRTEEPGRYWFTISLQIAGVIFFAAFGLVEAAGS